MLSAREYVEEMTLRRLNLQLVDDLPVDNCVFDALTYRIDHLITYYSTIYTVDGFTQEDLEGFFLMKIHQTLRRGQYDFEKSPFSFYKKIFTNLLKNLVRDLDRAKKNLHYYQVPDNVVCFTAEVRIVKSTSVYYLVEG